jgi:aspartyl-tRNA(Asn)/glutamyl-tRNA(Gln) amidotransferase subunit C
MLASCVVANPLTPAAVAHIAELARLELSAAEQERFARQLTDILTYAGMVQDVDTSRPAAAGIETPNAELPPLRADEAVEGLSRDEVLAQAPDRSPDGSLFRVPKVI